MNFLNHLAALWNLLLLIAAALTLIGFVNAVAIRKFLRARRIANARERRLLKEAAERERSETDY